MMDGVADQANGGSPETPAAADPGTVFSALADIIYQGSESSHIYAAICVAATLVVTGCDHASLLVRRDGRYVTVGASDSIAQRIDDMERTAGDGPCVDAIEEETPQIETDLTTPNQWPQLAARMVAETPVRGAMGFRILVDKRKTGALNLFSDKPNVFDTESAGQAIVLASFASVAINAVASGEDVSTLRRGLLSNRGDADDAARRGRAKRVRHPAPVLPRSEHQARRRGADRHREPRQADLRRQLAALASTGEPIRAAAIRVSQPLRC
jgi:transcriptional regulator with GAF, ATPase, and Fis domain